MPKVNITSDDQTLRILVGQDSPPCSFRLAYRICSARIVQEHVVDAARVPSVDSFCASEGFIANERVPSTIIVSSIVVSSVMILLFSSVSKSTAKAIV
jgi:hypothetical protein